MKNKCSNIKIKIYITMQCQSPYVFINKDIYTRISICTFIYNDDVHHIYILGKKKLNSHLDKISCFKNII